MSEITKPQWRAIETAPKDGTVIIVSKIVEHLVFWVRDDWWDDETGYWYNSTLMKVMPSHWLPLPDAPKATETTGGEE